MSEGRPYAEVIGDPIEHSRSPTIHGFWLKALGIEADYRRQRVERSGLGAYVERVRADPLWRGSNVTMPLKLDALALADQATDRAVAAGAANLLVPRDGRVFAGNTDVGAIAVLVGRMQGPGRPKGPVTLLGNGGAARAALVACKLVDAGPIRIQARDLAAATKLAVEFQVGLAPRPLTDPIEGVGLINSTPLGMAGRDCLNCDLSRLDAKGWVFDMVTDPVDTPLLKAARVRGLSVIDGLDMLVEQSAESFKLMFGAAPPRERDAELMRMLRA